MRPQGGARTTTGACGPIDGLTDRGGIRGGRGAPLSPSRAPVVAWRGREELGRVCRPAREEQRRRSRGAGAGVGVGVSSRSDAPCTRRGERMVGRSRWKAWSGTCSCGTGPERQGRPAYRIDADLRGWARTVVRFRSWVTRRARAKGTDLLARAGTPDLWALKFGVGVWSGAAGDHDGRRRRDHGGRRPWDGW